MLPCPCVDARVEERSPRILAGWLDDDEAEPLLKPKSIDDAVLGRLRAARGELPSVALSLIEMMTLHDVADMRDARLA